MLFLIDPERDAKASLVQSIYEELKNESCIANVRWSSKDIAIGSIPRCGFCYSDMVSTAEEIDELRQAAALLEKNVKLDIQQ